MDNAVLLVQAYLRINGYFTVTEFPIVEAMRHGGHRTATDLDILAVRFPNAARLVTRGGNDPRHDRVIPAPDSKLAADLDQADMIIAEVKEGRAELNRGARDPAVLRVALTRFGCCDEDESPSLAQELIRTGRTQMRHGHRARLLAFGSHIEEPTKGFHAITLSHVLRFTTAYLRENWDVFRVAELKDPALGLLATMIKSGIRFEGG